MGIDRLFRRTSPRTRVYRVFGSSAQDLAVRALPAINPRALRVSRGRDETALFVIIEARSTAALDAAEVMLRALIPSSLAVDALGQEMPDDTSSLEPA